MKLRTVTALVVSCAFSQPSWACEMSTTVFQLPGESEADARTRGNQFLSDLLTKRRLEQESGAFQAANVVYLARVVAEGERSSAPYSATVHPIASLKGPLPKDDRVLSDIPPGGLCIHRGDGDGALGRVGEPVVVFEGLHKSDEYRPRGIESYRTRFLRSEEVLAVLAKFGKELED